jgi:hypothetical protein
LAALIAAACGSAPSKPTGTGEQPVGSPEVFGWDGVGNRMLMTSLLTDGANPTINPTTWVSRGAEWTKAEAGQEIPEHSPDYGVLVYDSGRQRELFFFGADPFMRGPFATWEWDGQAWMHRETEHAPTVVNQWVSAAYSPELKTTVMIDTANVSASRQTWLYDGTDWHSVLTAHLPTNPAHVEYDSTRHSIVALSLADYQTWLFDGSDWSALTPAGSSSPAIATGMGRESPAVALDQQRGLWVIFGGFDGSVTFRDTWTGDGVTWTRRLPIKSPPARSGLPGRDFMAWDPGHKGLLLFGGAGLTGDLGDTWAWDGKNWTHLAGPTYPNPSPSRAPSPFS